MILGAHLKMVGDLTYLIQVSHRKLMQLITRRQTDYVVNLAFPCMLRLNIYVQSTCSIEQSRA